MCEGTRVPIRDYDKGSASLEPDSEGRLNDEGGPAKGERGRIQETRTGYHSPRHEKMASPLPPWKVGCRGLFHTLWQPCSERPSHREGRAHAFVKTEGTRNVRELYVFRFSKVGKHTEIPAYAPEIFS